MGTPSNGVVAVATANQAWTYTPKADWFGNDVFQYTVTSNGVTITALVIITVVPVSGEVPAADRVQIFTTHCSMNSVHLGHWPKSI
jgi:hypothetical protein